MTASVVVNGEAIKLDVDPNMPLLWAIREVIGLHGTKFGCGMAQCGACTVHIEGQPTRSCVTPVSAVDGQHITTIEGISSKQAKAVQAAWVKLQVPQLPIWSNHVGDGPSRAEREAYRCRYRRRDERKHLPLRDLFAHPRRNSRRRSRAGGLSHERHSKDDLYAKPTRAAQIRRCGWPDDRLSFRTYRPRDCRGVGKGFRA